MKSNRNMTQAFMILFTSLWLTVPAHANEPHLTHYKTKGASVIIIIGDGMGYPQLEAASLTLKGQKGALVTQGLPYQSEITTSSLFDQATDSAAAATAMGTGQKTNNGYVGRNPSGEDITNIFEIARANKISTGLITTVPLSHATPAGFAAHADHRDQKNRIIDQLLSRSRPNILFGAAEEINEKWARFKGYEVVNNRDALMSYAPQSGELLLSGQFGDKSLPWYSDKNSDLPDLPTMTAKALELLPEPFLLVIESGKIDWGAHSGDLSQVVSEVQALDDTVLLISKWLKDHPAVTVFVTADHETGGLIIDGQPQQPGQLPPHRWTASRYENGSFAHTTQKVPVFAMGYEAATVKTLRDNTDIFFLTRRLMVGDPIIGIKKLDD